MLPTHMRTRLSICQKKARFPSAEAAWAIAERSPLPLRPYRCDRCRKFHLTSRTKGKRVARRAELVEVPHSAQAKSQPS